MWSVVISFVIALGLVINHLVHGWGCWGLQPGGRISAHLYFLQLIVAGVATVRALSLLFRERCPGWLFASVFVALLAIVTAALYVTDGWVINTSIHLQGPENLIPFGAASATAILGGLTSCWALGQRRPDIRCSDV